MVAVVKARNAPSCLYDEHIAEAALVDDGDRRVVAEHTPQFVDVAVERVAVAGVVALPYCHHQFGGVSGLSHAGGEDAEYARLEVRHPCLLSAEGEGLRGGVECV